MKAEYIQAVILDLDDTLIPSNRFYSLAVAHILDGSSERVSAFQEARSQIKSTLPASHTSARNRVLYFKRYLELMGEDPIAALDLYDRYEKHLDQLIRDWSNDCGRLQLLERLKLKRPLYVLTNENCRAQLAKLAAICQSKTVFSGILTSEEAGCEKPDPGIFQLLLRRFDLQADRCLYVGDSFENDIIPAKALGMLCLQTFEFSEKGQSHDRRIPGTISHLDQLMEIL